jgi:hypothetical protein
MNTGKAHRTVRIMSAMLSDIGHWLLLLSPAAMGRKS